MTETYEFTATEPAKRAGRQGAGRRREHNPFEAAVREIVGTGQARQTQFTLSVENGETLKQRKDRIRRFLTRASKDVAAENGVEPYAIALTVGEVPGQEGASGEQLYFAKFWDRAGVRAAHGEQAGEQE